LGFFFFFLNKTIINFFFFFLEESFQCSDGKNTEKMIQQPCGEGKGKKTWAPWTVQKQKRRALVFVRTSWSVHHVTWARVPKRQWGPNGTVSFLSLFAKRPLVPTTGWFGGPIESGDWLERQHVALIICNCGVLPFSTDTWALGFILIFNWAPRSGWTGDESDDGIWCSFCL
jgi:hypothetical protein